MLQASSDFAHNPPSSPVRRLVQPAYPFPNVVPVISEAGSEFLTSTPTSGSDARDVGPGIREEAFSQNYYKKFFIEEKELGKGGKGVVYLVKHVLDGVSLGLFACKRVPVGNDHAWLEKVLIEVQLLQSLSHPNLVSYRHVWLEDYQPNRFGPTLPCAFILQQYCNSGDLLRYVAGETPTAMSAKEQMRERRRSRGTTEKPDLKVSPRRLKLEEIYSFFRDITSGLAHLHASNYIHRDLKPSNCLLNRVDNELRCLISDFGEVQSENVMRNNTGATGTISYCAPEVLVRGSSGRFGEFSTKSDVFSLGMILYFMCFGRLPYSCADAIQEELEDLDSLRAEIGTWSGFHDERKERPDLPAQLYEFLKRLLALDPVERPSAVEILQAISSGSKLATPTSPSRHGGTGDEQSFRVIQRGQVECSSSEGSNIHMLSEPNMDHFQGDQTTKIHDQASIRGGQDDKVAPAKQQRSISQRLLLPPPAPIRPQSWSHKVYSYTCRQTARIVSNNGFTSIFVIKSAIFFVKLHFLTQPCKPLSNSWLIYPLLLLAAVDLQPALSGQWMITSALIIAHFVTVALARRYGNLCVPQQELWRQ